MPLLLLLQAYGTLAKDMEKNSDEWEKWCVLEASEKAPMPGDWGKISDFRQLLIVRALKPGRITNALQVSTQDVQITNQQQVIATTLTSCNTAMHTYLDNFLSRLSAQFAGCLCLICYFGCIKAQCLIDCCNCFCRTSVRRQWAAGM